MITNIIFINQFQSKIFKYIIIFCYFNKWSDDVAIWKCEFE